MRSIVTTSQHRCTEAGLEFLVSCFIACTYSSARSSVISKPTRHTHTYNRAAAAINPAPKTHKRGTKGGDRKGAQ